MNKKIAWLTMAAAALLAGTEIFVQAHTGDLRVTGELRADGDFVAPARTIDATELATESVTTDKLAPAAVFTTAIRESAITTGKIASDAVTTGKMYLDQEALRIACYTTGKRLGYVVYTNPGATSGVVSCQ